MNKTNVMKILEQKKIRYNFFEYDSCITDGEKVAEILGEKSENVFKTLVVVDNTGHYFVFCIPVDKQLDLKKAAKLINKKSLDMIKQKELEPLTGYIHGGCSPIGMKKSFPTYIDEQATKFEKIYVSAGRVGIQIQIDVKDLMKITNARFLSISKEKKS